jgi:ABC-2 type transport system permease protein
MAATAGMVGFGALLTTSVNVDQCPSPAECFEDTARLSLTGVHVAALLVAVLAVLAVGNEYASGLARTTLTAMPGRLRVVTAKVVVVTSMVLAVGLVAVLGSLLAARAILPGNGFAAPSLGDEATLRAAVGTVLYLGLIALLSLGVALLVRDAPVALITVLALLYLAPVLAQFAPPDVAEAMLTYAPMNAGLAVQATIGLDTALIGPWAGLGVLAVWAGVGLVAGAARFARADG